MRSNTIIAKNDNKDIRNGNCWQWLLVECCCNIFKGHLRLHICTVNGDNCYILADTE